MKKTWKLAAVAAMVAAMASASAFADSRHRNETNGGWRGDARDDSRRNITMEGRVRSVDRDRDGYRVSLDRGNYPFFVPQSALRNRGRNDLRIGVSMRFTGFLRDNYVYVSSADFLGNDDYDYRDSRDRGRYGNSNREYIRGVVERVDAYRGTLLLRDERSGRRVTVFMNNRGRNRRGVDFEDLRRGDRVTISGDWQRGGAFEAYRVEDVRSGRW